MIDSLILVAAISGTYQPPKLPVIVQAEVVQFNIRGEIYRSRLPDVTVNIEMLQNPMLRQEPRFLTNGFDLWNGGWQTINNASNWLKYSVSLKYKPPGKHILTLEKSCDYRFFGFKAGQKVPVVYDPVKGDLQ